jgi:hypothetical protein
MKNSLFCFYIIFIFFDNLMTILIVDTSNQRETFEINEYDKVKVPKEKIHNKKRLNADITFNFNRNIIDEEKAIYDSDIQENDVIITLEDLGH